MKPACTIRKNKSLENSDLQLHRTNLYSDDAKIREAAVEGMVACGEEAVPFLIEIVKQPDIVSHTPTWRDNPWRNAGRNERARTAAKAALLRLLPAGLPALMEQVNGAEAKHRDQLLTTLLESDRPDAQQAFRTVFCNHTQNLRTSKLKQARIKLSLFLATILALPVIVWFLTGKNIILICSCVWQLIGLAMTVVLDWKVSKYALSNNIKKAIARKAKQGGDIEWLGVLLLILGDADTMVNTTIEESLLQILSSIKASDRNKIESSAMMTLIGALSSKWPKLALAILKALEQVGDERALPKVEAMFRELKGANGQTQRQLREAAEACLPYLRQKAEIASQSRTLLRASSVSHEEDESVLLRPSHSAGSTDSSELLRAANRI